MGEYEYPISGIWIPSKIEDPEMGLAETTAY